MIIEGHQWRQNQFQYVSDKIRFCDLSFSDVSYLSIYKKTKSVTWMPYISLNQKKWATITNQYYEHSCDIIL